MPMKPEDIITDLSAHLRRQGLTFNRADLETFAALARPGPTIEALAQRFRDSQAAAVRALRRRRVRAWLEAACLAGIAAVLLGAGSLFWLAWVGELPASATGSENTF